jgi:hypothetical protein
MSPHCPVRRPVTALDCVLLKDRNLTLAHRQGSKTNSQACFWVSLRPCNHIEYCLTNQRLILCISCLETPKAGSGPTNFGTAVPCELVGNLITSYPSMSRDPIQPHCMLSRDIIQCLLALLDQWRRSDGLKTFQSRLTIRKHMWYCISNSHDN